MTKINVQHIAKLASLSLSKDEEKKFEGQLEAILSHIESLSEVDVEKVKETSQVTGLSNVERPDEVTESLSQEDAIGQTKKSHDNLFVVPVLIEEAIEL